MELILLLIRIFLFGVFALAGIGKLLDKKGSEKAVKEFGVPDKSAKAVASALPIIELVIAFALMLSFSAFFAAISAFLLMLIFIVGIAYQMTIGKAPDCHCFGQIHSEPAGASTLIRNIIFALLALFLASQIQGLHNTDISGTAVLQVLILLASSAVVLLIVALSFLRKMIDGNENLSKRLNVMELISNEGSAPEVREEMGSPEDAIPIGSPIPDFEFSNAGGKNVKFEHFLLKGKPMLLFLVGPDCGPCNTLFPEIMAWKKDFEGRLEFIFVSRGTYAENKEKFGEDVLIQPNKELANYLGAKWTPTMFFINSNGNLASHPAVGNEAIKILVEKLRQENDLDREYLFHYNENSFTKKPKIGERVNEFEVKGLDGKTFTNKDLAGKRTLAISWSRTCSHCQLLVPEIIEWEKNNADPNIQLIVFSSANKEESKEIGISSPILLDDELITAGKIGLIGTPSALLFDENGVIQTEVGIGSKNIWALLGGEDKL